MGGKDAIVVDREADLDSAVAGVAQSAFGYQGQKCSACSRLILDEKIYDKFLDKLSDGDDMMRQIFTAVMPESAVKLLFTQVFVAAPGDKASDKWTRTDKVPLAGLGDLTNKTTYTVDGVKNDVATIKTAGDVTFKAGAGNAALPFKIAKADLKSDEVKGSIQFDTKAGRLKSSTTTMKLKGTMTIEVQNQQIEAEIDQKATTTVEVSEKNPVKD